MYTLFASAARDDKTPTVSVSADTGSQALITYRRLSKDYGKVTVMDAYGATISYVALIQASFFERQPKAWPQQSATEP